MRKPLDKANIYEVQLESHKIPVNIERQREGYVTFGEDNLYPNYLIELYNRSAKHNAIINSKVTYVYGKGLEMTVQDARLQELFDSVNRWQSLNEFAYQLVTDLELYNGTAIEIIWNRSGTSYEMKVLEFKNVRSNIDGSMFYYSPQWALYSTPDIIEYPAFDINNRKGRQIFYYKVYRPGCKVYPIVNYIGCIPYIETDIEISNYHLNNIKNGFWGGKVITFIAQQPTKEEMQAISRQFRYTKTGTDNAGKFVLNFVPNKESAPLIESLEPEDSDTKFEILNKTVLQEIFVGHQITSPMLMGVRVEGQLGGRTEMLDAYELFKNTYVNGRQQIAEKIINFHAENLTGIKGAYKLIPTSAIEIADIDGQDNQVLKGLNSLSPLVANKVLESMTPNEIRGIVGLMNVANGDVASMPISAPAPQETQQSEIVVNESLKNLTGRQMQNVMRIITKYSRGSLTYEQAVTMLRGGYGLTTEDIDSMLGETEEFSSQRNADEDLKVYQSFGVEEDKFNIVKVVREHFSKISEAEKFVESELVQNKILKILQETPDISIENIAKAISEKTEVIQSLINKMLDDKLIKATDKNGQIVRTPTSKGVDGITPKGKIPTITTMYRYEKRSDAPALMPGGESREFCQKMMKMKRLYSRQDIERMSGIFGYDVWRMKGGWYTVPNQGGLLHVPYCRHTWQQVLVTEK